MNIYNPDITVIMPVYNAEMYLKDAIDSVINQSFKNWELICVNDGSIDNSLKILHKFECLDDRIKVFDQKNSGATAARNVALDNARGKFIQELDSDDLLSEDCLQKGYEKAISSGADLVIPDLMFFKDNPTNIGTKLIGYQGDRKVQLTAKQAFFESLSWNISGLGLCRTELIRKIRYDETGMNGDEYTTRKIFLNCNNIVFCEGAYLYRQHINSTTKKVSLKRFDTLLTDFRILELAEEHQLDEVAKNICKEKILDNFMDAMRYLINHKKYFSKLQIQEVQCLMKHYFDQIDKTFITHEGKTFNYLLKRLLFFDYKFIVLFIGLQKIKHSLNKYFIIHK